MKNKILFLFISLLSLNIIHSKVFIPKDDGFIEKKLNIKKETALNIANSLGYNSEQFYGHFNFDSGNKNIVFVGFKIFTDKVIFVWTKDTINSLNTSDVKEFLTDFDIKKEFDAYRIEGVLEDGIKNKSLTSTFLSNIFNLENPGLNGILNANTIGYKIEFKQGIINKFYPSDGLNKWAKDWKNRNPNQYEKYYLSTSLYYDNESDIIKVINIQADASAHFATDDLENIEFHTNDDGTVNYKMLIVAQYFGKHFGGSYKINLQEFKFINKGKYKLSNEFTTKDGYKRATYRVNKGLYTFDESGKLISSYISN